MVKIPAVPQDNDPITFLPLSKDCLRQLQNKRAAVVGGGLGGLMAALRLSQHGMKVTVYEARPNVGGRVRSNPDFASGRVIEEGAELIGSFHTAWLKLAQKYGIAMISRMGELHYERERLNLKLRLSDTDTKDIPWEELNRLYEAMVKILEAIALDAEQISQPACPWEESDLKKRKELETFDKMSVGAALRGKYQVDPNSRLWKLIKFIFVNNEVAPLDQMNYLGLLCKVRGGQTERFIIDDPSPMGYWNELEIFRCADGSERLAMKMKEEITKNGGVIRVKTAVTQIEIGPQEVQLTTRNVRWPGGELGGAGPKEKYTNVVLAIPPSVWGGVTIKDEQGKLLDLKTEIGEMSMGPAVKFFSSLKKRFWLTEKIPSAPSGGTPRLGQVWEGTDNQAQIRGQGTVLNVFAGPIRPGGTGKGPRPPTQLEMQAELKKLYPGYAVNLIPRKTIYRDWPNEPFIKTGYWSPKPNGEIFKVGPRLNTPLHGRLYFAGEHTYLSFFGYMEGALRSGIRAANLLINQVCGLPPQPCPPPLEKVMLAQATSARKSTVTTNRA